MLRRKRLVSRVLALSLVLAPASVLLPSFTGTAHAGVCVGADVPIIGTGAVVCTP